MLFPFKQWNLSGVSIMLILCLIPTFGTAQSKPSFVDNIWYFGACYTHVSMDDKTSILQKSPGLSFVKDDQENFSLIDFSKRTSIASSENTLCVDVDNACGSQCIFYTSDKEVFNGLNNHLIGHFKGDWSNADGLACCYLGKNKYLLLSVAASVGTAAEGDGFYYYIIDLNANDGQGTVSKGTLIDGDKNPYIGTEVGEGIELIADPSDASGKKYNLIYTLRKSLDNNYFLRIKSFSVDHVEALASDASLKEEFLVPWGKFSDYNVKVSPNKQRIAFCCSMSADTAVGKGAFVFNYNASLGIIDTSQLPLFCSFGDVLWEPANSNDSHNQQVYGLEFSPNSNLLYLTAYSATSQTTIPTIRQYNLTQLKPNNTKLRTATNHNFQIPILSGQWPLTSSWVPFVAAIPAFVMLGLSAGGDVKMGPDSMLYILQNNSSHIGRIEHPNLVYNDLTPAQQHAFYVNDFFDLSVVNVGIKWSSAITFPVGSFLNGTNTPPSCKNDTLVSPTNQVVVASILPLVTDVDNNQVFVTNVDTTGLSQWGSFDIDLHKGTVSFKRNAGVDSSIHVPYSVKDNGTPFSECNGAELLFVVPPAGSVAITMKVDAVPLFLQHSDCDVDQPYILSSEWGLDTMKNHALVTVTVQGYATKAHIICSPMKNLFSTSLPKSGMIPLVPEGKTSIGSFSIDRNSKDPTAQGNLLVIAQVRDNADTAKILFSNDFDNDGIPNAIERSACVKTIHGIFNEWVFNTKQDSSENSPESSPDSSESSPDSSEWILPPDSSNELYPDTSKSKLPNNTFQNMLVGPSRLPTNNITGIHVRTSISPNGDQLGNEQMYIENIENYPQNEVIVFNKEGKVIFRMKNYNNHDRAFNGHPNAINNTAIVAKGTYFYGVRYNDPKDGLNKEVFGFIEIRY